MTTKKPTPMVNYFARTPVPPDYLHLGARVHSFPIPVDRGNLQKLCDEWFNKPSGGAVTYRVLLSRIFILTANIASIQPEKASYTDLGRASEIDVGMWILVLRTTPLSALPRWLPIRLFVDSGDAVVVGREVYGFPKEMGKCTVPATVPSSGPFAVDAFVTHQPNDVMKWLNVITVDSLGAPAGPPPPVWTTVEEATRELVASVVKDAGFGALDVAVQEAIMVRFSLSIGTLPFAFLKQFMSVNGSNNACYQAMLEAPADVVAFRRSGFTPDEYEITITSHHSHRFDTFLGLKPGPYKVGRGIWSDFDFSMKGGTVLFEA